jgi:hypothetical protein
MRKSTLYGCFLATGALMLTTLLVLHPLTARTYHDHKLRESRRLVRELGLTDLCLFTETRYTRHPSQADLHSAFQDHPFSLEHYPSGSMVIPPQRRPGKQK